MPNEMDLHATLTRQSEQNGRVLVLYYFVLIAVSPVAWFGAPSPSWRIAAIAAILAAMAIPAMLTFGRARNRRLLRQRQLDELRKATPKLADLPSQ